MCAGRVLLNGRIVKHELIEHEVGKLRLRLPIRHGVNTIRWPSAQIKSMSIIDSRFIDAIADYQSPIYGIDKGFVAIEAENANCSTGTIIGPTYTSYSDQPHLPTEASNRMACQLSSPDSLVEFVAPQSFNAISFRYSIPDAKDGNGLTLPLVVSVGGTSCCHFFFTVYFILA